LPSPTTISNLPIGFFIFVLFVFLLNGILKKNNNDGKDDMGVVMNEGDIKYN
jgi:hypothetical protein